MNEKYKDMLRLPHPVSATHPRMSLQDRAAQFSPFAALTGHGAAIAETSRITQERIELSEDEKTLLDNKLQILRKLMVEQPVVTVTWFSPDKKKTGGSYITTTGILKKFSDTEHTLILEDGTSIPLMDVRGLDSEWFHYWLGDLN